MCFRSVLALVDQNIIKNAEDFIIAEDCITITCVEAASSLFRAFLHGGGEKWMKNEHASFELEGRTSVDLK